MSSPDFIQLARDPFAREDVVRRSVQTFGSCTWCGGFRMRAGKALRHLFQYGIWRDAGKPNFEERRAFTAAERERGVDRFRLPLLFCSKACHDAYHGA
jgi:hypothetical protein